MPTSLRPLRRHHRPSAPPGRQRERWKRGGVAVVFAILAAALGTGHADDAQIIKASKQSIVFVKVVKREPSGTITEESGSGFICSRSGYVLTASHILQASRDAKVTVSIGSNTGETLNAYVVQVPGFVDAVLLQLPDSHAPYVPLGFGDPNILDQGDHLVVASFPLGNDYSSASGSLSNKAGSEGLWQVSIPLNYGDSGGPVMNSRGQAVGMVRGGVAKAQQINYMIPLNLLSPLISGCGLKWPPYENPTDPVVNKLVPAKITGSNCHEITVVAAGIPPVYRKAMICE